MGKSVFSATFGPCVKKNKTKTLSLTLDLTSFDISPILRSYECSTVLLEWTAIYSKVGTGLKYSTIAPL